MEGMTVNFDVNDYINTKKIKVAFNNLPNLAGNHYYLQLIGRGMRNATYTGSSADYTVTNQMFIASDSANTFDSSVKLIEKHPDPSRGCELEIEFADNEVRYLQVLLLPDKNPVNDFDTQEDDFDSTITITGNAE